MKNGFVSLFDGGFDGSPGGVMGERDGRLDDVSVGARIREEMSGISVPIAKNSGLVEQQHNVGSPVLAGTTLEATSVRFGSAPSVLTKMPLRNFNAFSSFARTSETYNGSLKAVEASRNPWNKLTTYPLISVEINMRLFDPVSKNIVKVVQCPVEVFASNVND